MHEEALPDASNDLLAALTADGGDELSGWVLAGGTGLALQLGHRISEDFDFFRTSGMDTAALFERLSDTGRCEALPRKYGAGRLNPNQVIMSLTYFDDAEAEPMPRMLKPFDWERCKEFFVREARDLVLP